MPFVVDELVKQFCKTPARRQLYIDVSHQTEIKFSPSDTTIWRSKTEQGQTTIFYASADYPEACLAHELLHAKLKCQGYKQYCTAICATWKRDLIATLLGILDNEL